MEKMNTPNENGVYEHDNTEELAREGRACVELHYCQCQDGLYRFALSMTWSYGGFGGPTYDGSTGYATAALAREEALATLIGRWPKAWPSEPASMHAELAELRRQIEQQIRQPSLF